MWAQQMARLTGRAESQGSHEVHWRRTRVRRAASRRPGRGARSAGVACEARESSNCGGRPMRRRFRRAARALACARRGPSSRPILHRHRRSIVPMTATKSASSVMGQRGSLSCAASLLPPRWPHMDLLVRHLSLFRSPPDSRAIESSRVNLRVHPSASSSFIPSPFRVFVPAAQPAQC